MKSQRNHARYLLGSIPALIALTIVTTFGLESLALAYAQAATPSWTFTGSLNTGRVFHRRHERRTNGRSPGRVTVTVKRDWNIAKVWLLR